MVIFAGRTRERPAQAPDSGIDHVHHAGGRFAMPARIANRPYTC
jgi:hypothetical protein